MGQHHYKTIPSGEEFPPPVLQLLKQSIPINSGYTSKLLVSLQIFSLVNWFVIIKEEEKKERLSLSNYLFCFFVDFQQLECLVSSSPLNKFIVTDRVN